MYEPRRLKPLWASTFSWTDNFIFFYVKRNSAQSKKHSCNLDAIEVNLDCRYSTALVEYRDRRLFQLTKKNVFSKAGYEWIIAILETNGSLHLFSAL
jgi:hypothetical protein